MALHNRMTESIREKTKVKLECQLVDLAKQQQQQQPLLQALIAERKRREINSRHQQAHCWLLPFGQAVAATTTTAAD